MNPNKAPALFRKKPVTVEAMQFKDWHSFKAIMDWAAGDTLMFFVHTAENHPLRRLDEYWVKTPGQMLLRDDADPFMVIETKEGEMRADRGDFIIRGIQGEMYPCKPDIFAQTYDPVAESEAVK